MKKKIHALLKNLGQSDAESLTGGFASLKGGATSIPSYNIVCTNDFKCDGTNKGGCSNNNDCSGTTNEAGNCTNSICAA